MKRQLYTPLILLVSLVFVFPARADKEERLSIQVRQTRLRDKPSFVGKPGATVRYASRVTVLERKNSWVRAQDSDGHSGWIHSSALTEKKIRLKSKKPRKKGLAARSKKDEALGKDEIALAGKGLGASSDISSAELNYQWVDKMEKIVIPEEKIQAFLEKQRAAVTPADEEAAE